VTSGKQDGNAVVLSQRDAAFTRQALVAAADIPGRVRMQLCYAAGYDVAVVVAGNKAQAEQDVAFLRSEAGADLVTWLGHEPAIRAREQGRPFSMSDLSDGTLAALGLLQDTLDARPRGWSRYACQAAEFHVRNARAWASAAVGEDLAAQIAPGFTLGRAPSRRPSRERVPESGRR
jgi:CO dehydrogenase maturation factor